MGWKTFGMAASVILAGCETLPGEGVIDPGVDDPICIAAHDEGMAMYAGDAEMTMRLADHRAYWQGIYDQTFPYRHSQESQIEALRERIRKNAVGKSQEAHQMNVLSIIHDCSLKREAIEKLKA